MTVHSCTQLYIAVPKCVSRSVVLSAQNNAFSLMAVADDRVTMDKDTGDVHREVAPKSASPTSPKIGFSVVEALVEKGPRTVNLEHTLHQMQCVTCPRPFIEYLAHNGTKSFETLPPMLLDDSPAPSSNCLYANDITCPQSRFQLEAYVPSAKRDKKYLGACMFDLNNESHVAVIHREEYTRTDSTGLIVCSVYDAPIAELEAAMWTQTKPSALEKQWLGQQAARASLDVRSACGAFMSELEPDQIPDEVLKGQIHLIRGVIPFLHLRTPNTKAEARRALALLFALDNNKTLQDIWRNPDLTYNNWHEYINSSDGEVEMKTVFMRERPPKTGGVPCNMNFMHNAVVDIVADCLLHGREGVDCAFPLGDEARLFTCAFAEDAEDAENAADTESVDSETEEILTLRHLTSKLCAYGSVTWSNILDGQLNGHSNISSGWSTNRSISSAMERIASIVFVASDVAMAHREVAPLPVQTTSSTEAGNNARFAATCAMAERIDKSGAMFVIRMKADNVITDMVLINETRKISIHRADEAMRIIACSKIAVVVFTDAEDIGVDNLNNSVHKWLLLEMYRLRREKLKVTDRVRIDALMAPSRRLEVPSAEAVDRLRVEMNERLTSTYTSLKNAIDELKDTVSTIKAAKNLSIPTAPVELSTVMESEPIEPIEPSTMLLSLQSTANKLKGVMLDKNLKRIRVD